MNKLKCPECGSENIDRDFDNIDEYYCKDCNYESNRLSFENNNE